MTTTKTQPRRVCTACKTKKADTEFRHSMYKGNIYLCHTCKTCRNQQKRFRRAVNDLKYNIRKKLQLAPYRVLEDLFAKDPSLWNVLADHIGLLELKRLVRAEKNLVLDEMRASSIKWHESHPDHSSDDNFAEIWNVAIAETLAGEGRKKVLL